MQNSVDIALLLLSCIIFLGSRALTTNRMRKGSHDSVEHSQELSAWKARVSVVKKRSEIMRAEVQKEKDRLLDLQCRVGKVGAKMEGMGDRVEALYPVLPSALES